jgi:hypothetical protein
MEIKFLKILFPDTLSTVNMGIGYIKFSADIALLFGRVILKSSAGNGDVNRCAALIQRSLVIVWGWIF